MKLTFLACALNVDVETTCKKHVPIMKMAKMHVFTSHLIATCPVLQGRCKKCGLRGHRAPLCGFVPLRIFWNQFELAADLGAHTIRRKHDAFWQWEDLLIRYLFEFLSIFSFRSREAIVLFRNFYEDPQETLEQLWDRGMRQVYGAEPIKFLSILRTH